jgi:hypothetical protein
MVLMLFVRESCLLTYNSCLLIIFHFTVFLFLHFNNLTRTIPSEVGLLTSLNESSIVWLLL